MLSVTVEWRRVECYCEMAVVCRSSADETKNRDDLIEGTRKASRMLTAA